MDVENFLQSLKKLNIKINIIEDKLRVSAPPGILTKDIADKIKQYKKQIISYLDSNVNYSNQLPKVKRESYLSDFPVSYSQQRLFYLDLMAENKAVYNEVKLLKITGDLDIGCLNMSFNKLIEQHEILRTVYRLANNQVMQSIRSNIELSIPVLDISQVQSDELTDYFTQQMHLHGQQEFNLEKDLLMNVKLYSLNNEHYLLLIMHQIICDGWTFALIQDELAKLYNTLKYAKSLLSAEDRPQYVDYAHWQKQAVSSARLNDQLAYWAKNLNAYTPTLNLPFTNQQINDESANSYFNFTINKTTRLKLLEYAKEKGVTPYAVLLSCFYILLLRYTNQSDIAIGSPTATRVLPELESMLGCFLNTIILRINISSATTFDNLVLHVKEVVFAALDNQEIPVDLVIENLRKSQNLIVDTPFNAMFTMQNSPESSTSWDGLEVTQFQQISIGCKFDIDLSITDLQNSFAGKIEYNGAIFSADNIQRLAAHFNEIIINSLGNTNQSILAIPMLPNREAEKVLDTWNASEFEYSYRDIMSLIEYQAKEHPNNIAVELDGFEVTYKELEQSTNQLAGYLLDLGFTPKQPVGLMMDRDINFMVSLLSTFQAGGAYLPLYTKNPVARIKQIITKSNLKYILTTNEYYQFLLNIVEDENYQDIHIIDIESIKYTESMLENCRVPIDVDDPAVIIFTSGTTGEPKGAVLNHKNIINHSLAMIRYLKMNMSDSLAQTAPLCCDISVWQCITPLLVGAKVSIVNDDIVMNALALVQYLVNNNASILQLVPSQFRVLLDEIENHPQSLDLHLKWMILCGEALPPNLCKKWLSIFPETPILNAYGPAECSDDVTLYTLNSPQDVEDNYVPIGKPLDNLKMYILNDALQPVPVGCIGEICIGGIGVGKGYINDLKKSELVFVNNPFADGQIYKTGDLGKYLDNGNVVFLGRKDFQVKVRGFRVELDEVQTIIESHLSIIECFLCMDADDNGYERLVAYVVANQPQNIARNLRSFLLKKLPHYMLPTIFISIDKMPVSPNGKIDRNSLPAVKEYLDATPQEDRVLSNKENILLNIWSELLGLENISIFDNFFEIGGDSILSIQIVSKARLYGVVIFPQQIFEYPTIETLAEVVEDNVDVVDSTPILNKEFALLPIQEWFFEQQFVNPEHYNQSIRLELSDNVDIKTLENAALCLLQRHRILNSRFINSAGIWQQIIPSYTVDMALDLMMELDFSTFSEEQFVKEYDNNLREMQANLSYTEGQLIKFALIRNRPNHKNFLLITAHHLVIDGVSWRCLLHDFYLLYKKASTGQEVFLNNQTTDYSKWSSHLSELSSSAIISAEIDYWRQISSKSTDCCLFANIKNNTVANSQKLSLSIEPITLQKLQHGKINGKHISLCNILTICFVLSLEEWLGKDELVFAMESHGRESVEQNIDLSHSLGWFTALFPVSVNLSQQDAFMLKIKEILSSLNSIPHNGLGYGLLKYRQRHKDLLQAKTPQVLFNYLGKFIDSGISNEFFEISPEFPGARHPLEQQRAFVLEVTSYILEDRLSIELIFANEIESTNPVNKFADSLVKNLEKMTSYLEGNESKVQVNSSKQYSTLECLNRGNVDYDPILLFPPVTGDLSCYEALIKHIPNEVPVYGFYQNPLNHTSCSIEDLSAIYLQEILTIREISSFCLIGWSMGGLIAYEVASQMALRNISSKCLIVDEPVPNTYKSQITQETSLFMNIALLLNINSFEVHNIIDVNNTIEENLERLYGYAESVSLLPSNISREFMQSYASLLMSNMQSELNYRPKFSSEEVTVISAKEQIYSSNIPSDMGWSNYAKKVTAYQLPGNHFSIINSVELYEKVVGFYNLSTRNYCY